MAKITVTFTITEFCLHTGLSEEELDEIVGLGMIERIEDLLGRQPDVNGVQDRAQHGHGKEAFEIAVAVPIHHRHRVARLDPQSGQGTCQPVDPLAQVAIGVT